MPRRTLEYACAVVVVGLLAGVAGAATTLLLHAVEHGTYHYSFGSLLTGVGDSSPVRRAVGPMIGGALAGFGWWLLRRRGDVPSLAATIAEHRPIPRWRMSIDAVLQVLLVGSGASLGREGAPRQLSAAFGDLGTSRWTLTPRDREILLACAAGAGLGAVYSVPLGGAVFAARILLGTWHPRAVGTALITSSLAVAVPSPVTHLEHSLVWPDPELSYLFVFLALAIAPLAVAVGLVFDRLMKASAQRRRSGRGCWCPSIAAAGLVTGVCSIWWPELPGNGRSILTVSVDSSLTLGGAAVILFLKPLLTALFLRAGAIGGLITPALATGAAAGIGRHPRRQSPGRTAPAGRRDGARVRRRRACDHAARAAVRSTVRLGAGASADVVVPGVRGRRRSRHTASVCSANATSQTRALSPCSLYWGPLTHLPASPTMPTGTAPDRLTFCTLGPAATIVVSCRIGSTVDRFHSRGSTAVITSPMGSLPSSAASMFGWMLRSQIPVRLLGACTSWSGSGGGAGVAVGVVRRRRRRADEVGVVVVGVGGVVPLGRRGRHGRRLQGRAAVAGRERRRQVSPGLMPAHDRVDPVVRHRVAVQRRRVQREHRRGDADAAQLVGGGVRDRDRRRIVGGHADHERQLVAVLADPAPRRWRPGAGVGVGTGLVVDTSCSTV